MVLKVAVWGATGRLGKTICEAVSNTVGLELIAELSSKSHEDADKDADIVVDATHLEPSQKIVRRALLRGQKVVVGTSGWTHEKIADLAGVAATDGAGVVVVPNFSLGSALQRVLSLRASEFFEAVEIIEAHHDKKVDSPSGTAIYTAEQIAASQTAKTYEAPFAEQTARGENVAGIPIHSLRLPGVLAKQDVIFGGQGETLTVTHTTYSAEAYNSGIILAIKKSKEITGITVGLESLLGV